MLESVANAFRDFATNGVPASGDYRPDKAIIRRWGRELERAVEAFTTNGGLVYATKTEIDADLLHAANASAWVVADSVAVNNGIYRKAGASGAGSWSKVAELPYSVVRLSDIGAGSANAIQATSDVPVSASAYSTVMVLNVFEENTGAVTLSVNGGTARPLVDVTGAALVTGALQSAMALLVVDDGANYRILTDYASAANEALAQSHMEDAQSARDVVLGLSTAFILGENTFSDIATAEAWAPVAAPDYIRTAGYTGAGDGGGALYKQVGSEPSHAGKFSITLSDAVTIVWYEIAERVIDPKMFGATGDGVTDDTAAIGDVRDYLNTFAAVRTAAGEDRSVPVLPKILFSEGIYLYSVSPNWAIKDAVIDCAGEVRLRYTGTGNAVILDAGSATDGLNTLVFNCRFGDAGRFIVEAPATAGHGIFVRSFHNGKVKAVVRGAGATSAGLQVNFAVNTDFDVQVTVNHEGWYESAMPQYGFKLDQRNSNGESVAYCNFYNWSCDAVQIGVQLGTTLGNNFWGGAAQGCTQYGVFASTAANLDKFWGTDFEVNTTADAFVNGEGIRFINCESDTTITFGSSARNCSVEGGAYHGILLDAGSEGCLIRGVQYNRFNTGGTITDSGALHTIIDNISWPTSYPDLEIDRYVTFQDDFAGDTLDAAWRGSAGTDPQALAPALGGSVLNGIVRLVAGDDAAATMAVNGSQLDRGVNSWRIDSGGFDMTFRIKLDSITACSWFIGMTDQVVALEMPFTLSGTTLTSNATDAFGILFDTDATTDNWKLVGVANDVDATVQDAGVAPVANTYETWRIVVTNLGVAKFYRNKVLIGSAMTGAVRGTVLLTPVLAGFSRTTTVKRLDCDVIRLRSKRA